MNWLLRLFKRPKRLPAWQDPANHWIDPVGVLLRPVGPANEDCQVDRYGISCDHCGCPGYTCVEPRECCRYEQS